MKFYYSFYLIGIFIFVLLRESFGGVLPGEHVAHYCFKNVKDADKNVDVRKECGPENWPESCTKGQNQSPIDILEEDVLIEVENRKAKTVNFSPTYCKNQTGFFIENNGHTIETSLNKQDESPSLFIERGELFPAKYIFSQLHLHWGENETDGSEHKINGKGYTMEMHLVHIKDTQEAKEAVRHSDHGTPVKDRAPYKKPKVPDNSAIAVLGIFFKETDGPDNPVLAPMLDGAVLANRTNNEHHSIFFKGNLSLYALLPGGPTKGIYQYQGSLTTPDCDEIVLWTVFETPVHVSKRQMDTLHQIHTEHHQFLNGNFRPTQPLNGRKLKKHYVLFNGECEKDAKKWYAGGIAKEEFSGETEVERDSENSAKPGNMGKPGASGTMVKPAKPGNMGKPGYSGNTGNTSKAGNSGNNMIKPNFSGGTYKPGCGPEGGPRKWC